MPIAFQPPPRVSREAAAEGAVKQGDVEHGMRTKGGERPGFCNTQLDARRKALAFDRERFVLKSDH